MLNAEQDTVSLRVESSGTEHVLLHLKFVLRGNLRPTFDRSRSFPRYIHTTLSTSQANHSYMILAECAASNLS